MKGSNRRKVVAGAAAVARGRRQRGGGGRDAALARRPRTTRSWRTRPTQLGVEPDELEDAIEQALENRLDEAVKAGRMTQEQADALKERHRVRRLPALRRAGRPRRPSRSTG